MTYQILPWDSEQFGFTVARMCEATADPLQLQKTLDALREQQVRLVYYSVLEDHADQLHCAEQCGGLKVDDKCTYFMSLDSINQLTTHPKITAAVKEPTAELTQLAYDAGLYSRFKTDPNIPDSMFKKIYQQWLLNSLNHSIADDVLIYRENAAIAGMMTVGQKKNRGDIGLLAVNDQFRGQGIGRALVQVAQHYFCQNNLNTAQVVTQRQNHPACQLYEKCGFISEKTECYYHFWF